MVPIKIVLVLALAAPDLVSLVNWVILSARSVVVVVGKTFTVNGPPLPIFAEPAVGETALVVKYPLESELTVHLALRVTPS